LLAYRSTHSRIDCLVKTIVRLGADLPVEDRVIEQRASGDNVGGLVGDDRDLDLPKRFY
jgi:hypothetical protein